jgi:parvulin-like peptidyl-prolyl isomerase
MANLNREWKPLTKEQLEGVLDELVNNELISQDAVSRGLERSSETQRRWAFTRRGFFTQEWLRTAQEQLDVSSADVEAYYEQNRLGFRIPEQRRLRELVVENEAEAKRALAKLLDASADFEALARELSEGPSAKEGGMLSGWVMRAAAKAFVYPSQADAEAAGVTSLDPTLEAAAFAIDQVNGLSSYVKGSDNRYHIFQLVERREERQRPISEVWDQIKNFLQIQRLQERIEKLRSSGAVERFPERLEGVVQ